MRIFIFIQLNLFFKKKDIINFKFLVFRNIPINNTYKVIEKENFQQQVKYSVTGLARNLLK